MISRKDRYGHNTRYNDKDNQFPNVLNCIDISFDYHKRMTSHYLFQTCYAIKTNLVLVWYQDLTGKL